MLQEENQALQQMVVDLAANKREAKERLAGLKEDYNHLISEVRWPLICVFGVGMREAEIMIPEIR